MGLLVLGGLLPGHDQNAELVFSIVQRETVEQRLASPPSRNQKRRDRVIL